jgi:hypothetical protein
MICVLGPIGSGCWVPTKVARHPPSSTGSSSAKCGGTTIAWCCGTRRGHGSRWQRKRDCSDKGSSGCRHFTTRRLNPQPTTGKRPIARHSTMVRTAVQAPQDWIPAGQRVVKDYLPGHVPPPAGADAVPGGGRVQPGSCALRMRRAAAAPPSRACRRARRQVSSRSPVDATAALTVGATVTGLQPRHPSGAANRGSRGSRLVPGLTITFA